MRAKLVSESLDPFEERLRKRREEFERESRELEKKAREDRESYQKLKTRSDPEPIRYANEISPEYKDKVASISKRKRKKEEAKARIHELSLGTFSPTPEGIQQILDWRDEDGNPFDPNDYILRTNDGSGELVVYDDSQKLGVDISTQLRNDYSLVHEFPFTDIRPITFKNWKRRPFEEQISTLKDGKPRKRKEKKTDIIGKYD